MNCSDKRFNYRRAPRTNLRVCLQRRCLEEVRKTGLPGMVQNSPSSKTVTVQFKISKVKRQEIRSVEPRAVHCKNMIQGTRQDIHPLLCPHSFSPGHLICPISSHPFQRLPVTQGLLTLSFSCHLLSQPQVLKSEYVLDICLSQFTLFKTKLITLSPNL